MAATAAEVSAAAHVAATSEVTAAAHVTAAAEVSADTAQVAATAEVCAAAAHVAATSQVAAAVSATAAPAVPTAWTTPAETVAPRVAAPVPARPSPTGAVPAVLFTAEEVLRVHEHRALRVDRGDLRHCWGRQAACDRCRKRSGSEDRSFHFYLLIIVAGSSREPRRQPAMTPTARKRARPEAAGFVTNIPKFAREVLGGRLSYRELI
jgi:hypothetical protein